MPRSPVVQSGSDSTQPTPTEQSEDPRRAAIAHRQPSTAQNIAKMLQDFGSQVTTTASLEADREHVAKKIRLEEKVQSKAEKRQFQFPALRRDRGYDSTLAQVEQKLQSQRKMQEQLAQSLASSLCHASESSLFERIQDSHAELVSPEFKQELGEMKGNMTSQVADIRDIYGRLNTLNTCLDSAKRSIGDLSASDTPIIKLEESLHRLENSCKENNDAVSQQIEELRQGIHAQKSLNDSTLKTCSDLEEKMAHQIPSMPVSMLQSDIQNLSDQFQNLRDMQETKDGLVAEEVDRVQSSAQELKGTVKQLSEKTAGLQQEIGNLQRSSVAQDTVAEMQQQIGNIHGWLKSLSESRDTLNTAIYSLQTRYNNISTEHVVSRMAAEMHNMYPFAVNAQREVQDLHTKLGQVHASISSLNNRVESLDAAEKAPSIARIDAQYEELKREKKSLGQELEAHSRKIAVVDEKMSTTHTDSLEQLTSAKEKVAEDMRGLKADIGDVERVTSDQLAKTMGKMESLEETMSDMKATIQKFYVQALQEHRQKMGENGHVSSEGSSPQASDSDSPDPPENSSSTNLHNVSAGPNSLQSRSTSGQSPVLMGRHFPTSPTTHTPKKRKWNGSLHHRVSR